MLFVHKGQGQKASMTGRMAALPFCDALEVLEAEHRNMALTQSPLPAVSMKCSVVWNAAFRISYTFRSTRHSCVVEEQLSPIHFVLQSAITTRRKRLLRGLKWQQRQFLLGRQRVTVVDLGEKTVRFCLQRLKQQYGSSVKCFLTHEFNRGNYCCRGKAIIITYCVSLASVIQHAKRMRRIIQSSVACLVLPFDSIYSLHYSHNYYKQQPKAHKAIKIIHNIK